MRADRLITTLLLLQNRGRMSARELAEELEVSTRTVMRDLEALGSAGVPIYSERGPAGGYELWEGFRTQLTSLTRSEVQASTLIGLPAVAQELGLGEDVSRFAMKLGQALPVSLAGERTAFSNEFLVDLPSTGTSDLVDFFATAVRRRRQVEVRVNREAAMVLDPLGMVRTGDGWWLVGLGDGKISANALSRFGSYRTTGATFQRPADFDLVTSWARLSREGALSR